MNNIESTKDVLRRMCDEIEKHSTELNELLDNFKIRHLNVSHTITSFKQQIKSVESKFTIAFVGTFKTGKSTIINSLLELKGDARLSSEYDPDTAKCVRLICADDNHRDGDAVVDFNGAYPEECLPWQEAKKYTSQVALDKADKMFREKASHISEVRYYISSPLLNLCNILDLPGTGTGGYSEHTDVTDEKILEADCFFWVVSTSDEPDLETVKNLEKIKHKLLPIINVWQKECEDISSSISPEDTIATIQEGYSAYLANADAPVVYYAGEIDNAQQKGEEIQPEWGKIQFTEKVESILQNIRSGDRARRIESNLISAIGVCRAALEVLENDPAIIKLCNDAKTGKKENVKIVGWLEKCKRVAEGDIKNEANKTASEIVEILAEATDRFIYSKMDGLDLKAMVRAKKKYGDELLKDYQDNYIRLHDGWVQSLGNDFQDNVRTILDGIFIDFETDTENIQSEKIDSKILDSGNFAENIASGLKKDMLEKFLPMLLETIGGIVLLFIPGLNMVDSAYWITSAHGNAKNVAKTDKLQRKAQNIALQSHTQIRQQKYTIVESLKTIGMQIMDRYYSKIKEELVKHGKVLDTQIEKYNNIVNSIATFKNDLDMQETAVKELFSK